MLWSLVFALLIVTWTILAAQTPEGAMQQGVTILLEEFKDLSVRFLSAGVKGQDLRWENQPSHACTNKLKGIESESLWLLSEVSGAQGAEQKGLSVFLSSAVRCHLQKPGPLRLSYSTCCPESLVALAVLYFPTYLLPVIGCSCPHALPSFHLAEMSPHTPTMNTGFK